MSPATAGRNLAIWRGVVAEMPATFGLLEQGQISESAAWWVGRETHFLDPETRTEIDTQLAGHNHDNRPVLAGLTWRQAKARATAAAVAHDPYAVLARSKLAEKARCVTIRPAPDNNNEDVPRSLRLMFAEPGTGRLVTMESKARQFPKPAREYLAARDHHCRTPNCQAPILEADHITSWANNGPTHTHNGEGLCRHCNLTKEQPGWHHQTIHTQPGHRHTINITTPTGHTYQSTAPPILWTG